MGSSLITAPFLPTRGDYSSDFWNYHFLAFWKNSFTSYFCIPKQHDLIFPIFTFVHGIMFRDYAYVCINMFKCISYFFYSVVSLQDSYMLYFTCSLFYCFLFLYSVPLHQFITTYQFALLIFTWIICIWELGRTKLLWMYVYCHPAVCVHRHR